MGIAVSISGDKIIVGTAAEDEDASGANTLTSSGSAYIFQNSAGTWSQDQKIVASDRGTNDQFGFAVAISGSHALVGAHYEDEDGSGGSTKSSSGSAYLYYAAPDVSLPVTLGCFESVVEMGAVRLNWSTESEVENLGFILERRAERVFLSSDEGQHSGGNHWRVLASYQTYSELEGAGSSNTRSMYAFTDDSIEPGITYEYRLADVSYTGEIVYHSMTLVGVMIEKLPETYALSQNYPNPFNPQTTICYSLPEQGDVSLIVFDITGREVITLKHGSQSAGFHELRWNGLDGSGRQVATGVYYCLMQTPQHRQTVKMMLLR